MAYQISITRDAESQWRALSARQQRLLEAAIVLLLVGRKVGNKLIVEGEVFHGHQDHPVESAGDEPPGDLA
jgi:mRNA-degrading endonuclease RelE of RelBE toxin-antitoxin system